MKFQELVALVGHLPVFPGSLLLAGERDPGDVRRQLARWNAAGQVLQLRRNVYVLAAPWRRVTPHPFVIANALHHPGYVSLQSALAHYGMIPESVPVTTSVTSGRPMAFTTPLGRYVSRHVRPALLFGYRRVPVLGDQEALLADPAKALLDLMYLTPGGDSAEYLESLRLDGLEAIRARDLRAHARRWGKHKIDRAVEQILRMKQPLERRAGAR